MAETKVYNIKFAGTDAAKKDLDGLNKRLVEQREAVRDTQDEIKDLEKNWQEMGIAEEEAAQRIEDLNVSLLEQKDAISETGKQRRTVIKGIETMNTALEAEAGSNEQLRAQLKLLTTSYDGLSEEQRENSEEGKALTENIKNITDKLKENESAVGDNRRNVGNYSEAIDGALGKVNLFGVNLGQAKKQLVASATSMKAATGVTNTFKIALLALPIFAVVAALTALGSIFLSTQRGADAMTRILTPLRFMFERTVGILQEFVFGLVDTVKSFGSFKEAAAALGNAIKDNIIERLESMWDSIKLVGKALGSLMNGDMAAFQTNIKDLGKELLDVATGIEDFAEKSGKAFAKVRRELHEAKLAGEAFAETEIALNGRLADIIVNVSELNKAMKAQELIAQDQVSSDQDRIDALDKAEGFLRSKIALEKEELEIKEQLLIAEQGLNDTSNEEKQELAKIQASINDLEAAEAQQLKRIESQRTGLQKKIIAAEEARVASIEKLIATSEELYAIDRDKKLESLGLLKDETELTEIELKARQKIYEEYHENIGKLRDEQFMQELDLLGDSNSLELLQLELQYSKKLIAEEDYLEQKYELQKNQLERQQSLLESELGLIESSLADDLLSPEDRKELEKALVAIRLQLSELSNEYNDVTVDEDTGEKNDILALLGLDEKGIERFYASQAVISQGLQALSELSSRANSNRLREIDQRLQNENLSADQRKRLEAEFQEIEYKGALRSWRIKVAQGAQNAILAPLSAFAQTNGGIIAKSIAAAVAGAFSIGKLALLKQEKPKKFADGGHVRGAGTKTSDSIPAWLSNGEFVMKADAVNTYGVDFFNSLNSLKLASGGLVQAPQLATPSTSAAQGINNLSSTIQQLDLRVKLVESDVTSTQNRVSNVEASGTY